MRFKSKFIAIVILLSLVFVVGYQVYWLRNFYNEKYNRLEAAATNALNNADFKEIATRITYIQLDEIKKMKQKMEENPDSSIIKQKTIHKDGEFETTVRKDSTESWNVDSLNIDSLKLKNPTIVIRIESDENDTKVWSDASSMSLSIQQGLHRVLDSVQSLNFVRFDSLLQIELDLLEINIPYFVDYVDTETDSVIMRLPQDLNNPDLSNYQEYSFTIADDKKHAYHLYLESPKWNIFKSMLGLVTVSILMTIILIISYVYLLRIIFRQKSIDEIKGDFINNMTHELKTPISVTYAAIDALQNFGLGDDPVKRDKYLTISKEQLVNLNSLVEQILTMSVEERKNLKLVPVDISISGLFTSLENKFMLNASKDISFETNIEPDDLIIKADKIHFQNIIANLVENAIKYSNESVNIKLSAYKKDNRVIISISDNGIGIPSSAQDKIFDKFYRVSTGNVHNVKGYGLGLFYVKTIVDKHGWKISVDSTEGKGSSFKITI